MTWKEFLNSDLHEIIDACMYISIFIQNISYMNLTSRSVRFFIISSID